MPIASGREIRSLSYNVGIEQEQETQFSMRSISKWNSSEKDQEQSKHQNNWYLKVHSENFTFGVRLCCCRFQTPLASFIKFGIKISNVLHLHAEPL